MHWPQVGVVVVTLCDDNSPRLSSTTTHRKWFYNSPSDLGGWEGGEASDGGDHSLVNTHCYIIILATPPPPL